MLYSNFNYSIQSMKLILSTFYGVSVRYLYSFNQKNLSRILVTKPVVSFLDYDNIKDDIYIKKRFASPRFQDLLNTDVECLY